MAKAATSGQARSFNAMTISRIDEKVLEQIDSEKFQEAIDKPNEFISKFISWINNRCEMTRLVVARILENLAFICEITIENVAEFVVGENFDDSKNKFGIQLELSEGFKSLLIEPIKKKKVSLAKDIKLEKFSLLKPMFDTEIQDNLKNSKPIDVEIFLPLLWGMLSLQKNGEKREDGLQEKSGSNVFHIELKNGRVITAFVYFLGGFWRLGDSEYDFGRWVKDDIFFSLLDS